MNFYKIDIKKLFIVAVVLKIGALIPAGLIQGDWAFWLFGTALPLLVMLAYIFIGYFFRDPIVSDEKFSDSCYYLGFIFTIATILATLVNLRDIGSDFDIIALRFGVAMVSTLLGVIARVFIIGFKQDSVDAMNAVEDQIIHAANKLTLQLTNTVERLGQLDTEINNGTDKILARIESELEKVSRDYTTRLSDFFNQHAEYGVKNLEIIKNASEDFSAQVSQCSRKVDSLNQTFDKFSFTLKEQQRLFEELNMANLLRDVSSSSHKIIPMLENNNQAFARLESTMGKVSDTIHNELSKANLSTEALKQSLSEAANQFRLGVEKLPLLDTSVERLNQLVTLQNELAQKAEVIDTLVEISRNNNQLLSLSEQNASEFLALKNILIETLENLKKKRGIGLLFRGNNNG